MKTLNRFLIRLRNLVTGQRGDQRLREELEDHVAREAEANIQAGMSEEEARRRARMKLAPRKRSESSTTQRRDCPCWNAWCRTRDFRCGR